jgi:hypothetical protein
MVRGDDSKSPGATDLAAYDALVRPRDREHWAFRPVRRPEVPTVTNPAWVRNPIDAFVLAKLESRGWEPAPAAEPRQLLRRVFLDVIGLPPTTAEQETFLNCTESRGLDRAFDELVSDLLARPGYGERWGRHWLDLVRYAETNGYERDATKPNVWRYRDYVIRSLNDDKPFDRFILEQIAGDELPDVSGETLIATGFHRLGHWDDEPADPKEDRFDQLDDIVSTTANVFLGLSIGCARCHNHKFEPLTMHDYYRMVAVFNPLVRPQDGRTELDMPAGTRDEIEAQTKRDARIATINKQIATVREAARREFIESGRSRLAADVHVAFWTEPAKRTDDQKKLVIKHAKQLDEEAGAALSANAKQRIGALEAEVRILREQSPDLARGYFMNEPASKPPATHLLVRGKATRPGPEVAPGVPAVLVNAQPGFPEPGERTSLRRLTLARWIADPENPLTARVIVNRVWQFHFGEGLVRTPNEFGRSGDPPTHAELVDWLAHWFVHDADWSLKKLHALILTSNAYRMNKQWNAKYGEADPENWFLWRQNYRRLEVEAIRDTMLAASGQLNSKMFGPSMLPPVPREALEGNSDPDKIWKASDEREAARRSVYIFIKRAMVVPMLEVLDLCDSTRSSARRQVTTVAPQALSLFNSDFVNQQARHLAARVVREAGDDPKMQIEHAYRLALCRPATVAEQTRVETFLKSEAVRLAGDMESADQPITAADAQRRGLEQFCRTILNLNEFVYTD